MTLDQLRAWSDEVLATSPALWARGLREVAQAVRELFRELDRLKRDSRLTDRIMEGVRRYSEGDKQALGGMGVAWVDELLAELDAAREHVRRLREFAKDISANYDHENDYHRKGMAASCCRVCKAMKVFRDTAPEGGK